MRAAENGGTEAELDALFGWRGGGMAGLYTREANRKRLALGAADKVSGAMSIPPPAEEVGETGRKASAKQRIR